MRWLRFCVIVLLAAAIGCGGGDKDADKKDNKSGDAGKSGSSGTSGDDSGSGGSSVAGKGGATNPPGGPGAGGAAPSRGGEQNTAAANPITPAYMPADTVGALVIHPQQIFSKIPKDILEMAGDDLFREFRPFDVKKVKRLTLYATPNVAEAMPVVVVEMDGPIDARKLLSDEMGGEFEEIDVKGKKIFRPKFEGASRAGRGDEKKADFEEAPDFKREEQPIEKDAEKVDKDECQDKKDTGFDKEFDDKGPSGFDNDFEPQQPYMYNEGNLLVIGNKDLITAALSQPAGADHAVAKLMSKVAGNHDAFALGVMDPVRDMIAPFAGMVPQETFDAASLVAALDAAVVTMDIGEGKSWTVSLVMNSANSASSTEKSLNGLKDQGMKMYAQSKGMASQEIPQAMRGSMMEMSDKIVNSLTIKAAGNRVNISLQFPSGFQAFLEDSAKQVKAVAADRMRDNNFRQFGIAFHSYYDTFTSLPTRHKEWLDKDGKMHLSWRVHLLPYLEQSELYDKFRFNEPWDSDHNKKLIAEMPDIYKTTDDPTKTTIMAFQSEDGKTTAGDPGTKFQEIIDGMSNTLLLVEAAPKHAVIWTKPDDLKFDPKNLPSLGRDGEDFVLVLFADGHTSRIPRAKLTPELLIQLINRKDGEPQQLDFD